MDALSALAGGWPALTVHQPVAHTQSNWKRMALTPFVNRNYRLMLHIESARIWVVLTPFVARACRWALHIVDTNPNSLSARGWLEDTSKVQKYTMTDEQYRARDNTYWKYKEQKLKVRFRSLPAAQVCCVLLPKAVCLVKPHYVRKVAHPLSNLFAASASEACGQVTIACCASDKPTQSPHVTCVSMTEAWSRGVLAVQEDPEWTAEKELCMRRGMDYVAPKQREAVEDEDYMSAEAASLSVGQRCEVDPGGKRGVIRSSARTSPSEWPEKPLSDDE